MATSRSKPQRVTAKNAWGQRFTLEGWEALATLQDAVDYLAERGFTEIEKLREREDEKQE